MTEKRFTTVELPKPNKWGIWYDGAYLSTYQVCILLNEYVYVKKENEQLKSSDTITDLETEIMELKQENEQLKQRNDRQAKQLDRLYRLIEEKDWRTLTDILDDFKRCEEQLQREWRTYSV